MEKKKYRITVGNESKEFEEGVTYQHVAEAFRLQFQHPVVLRESGRSSSSTKQTTL